MLKKIVPVVVLAAFMAAPVAAPVFAAEKTVKDCAKISDKAKKQKCMDAVKQKKK